jgi:hypothetical protein
MAYRLSKTTLKRIGDVLLCVNSLPEADML